MNHTQEKDMPDVRVVGAAIVREGRVLATRRGPALDQAGLWEFPGGKVERDEKPIDALRREVAEELGIDIGVGDHLATGRAMVGGATIQLDVYLAQAEEVAFELREHDRAKWLSADQLWTVEWADADIPAVEALEEHLSLSE